MKFKIGKFATGINDWLRYYVITVERNGKYLRKDGTIQDTTGLAPYSALPSSEDTPDSGNFPTIWDAIKTIESVGGTYEFSSTVIADIRTKLMSLSDDKIMRLFMGIEELCGPL